MHPAPDAIRRRRVVQGAAVAAGDQVQEVRHCNPATDAGEHGASVVAASDLTSQTLNMDLAAGKFGEGAGSLESGPGRSLMGRRIWPNHC